jgi:hypothetical protein
MIVVDKQAQGYKPSTSSLGSCDHTFVTDCNINSISSTDISSAARMFSIYYVFPPDLQVVIHSWESLSEALRKAIVLVVETGKIVGSVILRDSAELPEGVL